MFECKKKCANISLGGVVKVFIMSESVCGGCYKKYIAELTGTFFLVFLGCGIAAFSGSSIGNFGVSVVFGLTLMTMIYAFAGVSGAHFNPAVTVTMLLLGKIPVKDFLGYIISQLIGATVAGIFLKCLNVWGFGLEGGIALNGFGAHSPTGINALVCFLVEAIATGSLIFIILMVTRKHVVPGFAPLAIGAALTVLLLFAMPVTNASLNFARSFGVAIVHGGWAIHQLWLFAAAQLVGAVGCAIDIKIFFPED